MDRRYRRDFRLPTVDELRELAILHRQTPLAPRIRILEALSEDLLAPIDILSEKSGLKPRTIHKHLRRLREGGVTLFLRDPTPKPRLDRATIESLRGVISTGRFRSCEEIRRWVKTNYGVTYELSGIVSLVNRECSDLVRRIVPSGPERHVVELHTIAGIDVRRMSEVLQLLPDAPTVEAWIDQFKIALKPILPGSSAIYLVPVTSAPVDASRRGKTAHRVGESSSYGGAKKPTFDSSVVESEEDVDESTRRYFASSGFYDPDSEVLLIHHVFDRVGNRLGSIVVVYSRGSDGFTRGRAALDHLAVFLRFCMLSLLMTYRRTTSDPEGARHALRNLLNRHGLTRAERKICGGYMLGKDRTDLAQWRGVSLGTIDKQLRSIHRKLGVENRRELLAFVSGLVIGDEIKEL